MKDMIKRKKTEIRSLPLNKRMNANFLTHGNITSTVKSTVCFHLDSLYISVPLKYDTSTCYVAIPTYR